MIKKKLKLTPRPPIPTTNIEGCNFVGVPSVRTIQTIADGLVENAKALGNLAGLLRSQNATIDSLFRVNTPSEGGYAK